MMTVLIRNPRRILTCSGMALLLVLKKDQKKTQKHLIILTRRI
jgi:hypothetical protein